MAMLSVVLPAFNEEENIENAVSGAFEALASLVDELEVIVVDDGSSDGTSAVTTQLMARLPGLRLLTHIENQGYGAALRSGFGAARGDLIFYTDADNQFDFHELVYFLPMLESNDVIVGFRVYRYDTVLRSILSWVYNRIVRILFRVKVRDVDCSYKLFRREVLDKLDLESADFFVDTEIVARARKWNFRIAEKGVRHYPRTAGATTVRASDIPGTLRTVAEMWKRIYFPSKRQLAEGREARARLASSAVEVEPAPSGRG